MTEPAPFRIKKPKQVEICKDLHIELYNTVLNILIADTVHKALKLIDCHKERPREYWDGAHAVFNISPVNGCWALGFAADKMTPGTIAHECGHAAYAILRQKGIKYCRKSEEAFTYLLGYLVDQVTTIAINAGVDVYGAHAKQSEPEPVATNGNGKNADLENTAR